MPRLPKINFFMEIVSINVLEPEADTDPALLKSFLRKCFHICYSLMPKLFRNLVRDSFDMEIKVDLILTDSVHHLCRQLELREFEYECFGKNDTSGIFGKCGDSLQLEDHAHLFCPVAQFSFQFKAVPACTENVIFQDARETKQERQELMTIHKKKSFLYVRPK